ncbi:MAG TPA: YdcF family protein [Pyrinomonadaceae bacterium]|nr:YdcF family protein [Pyrinomonadaceae bacterium]
MAFGFRQRGGRGSRARRWAWRAGLFLLAWSLAAWGAARLLVVRAELARADALIVLSGGSFYEERARHAAELFAEGRAPLVVLTDDGLRGPWSDELERNPTYAELEAEELARAGVPRESVSVVPELVSSTYDEAVRVRDYARARGLRSVLVVTSPYHSRRALWVWRLVFRGSGIEVGLDPATEGAQSPPAATWWWHLRGWRAVAFEYPKMAYYWLRYS